MKKIVPLAITVVVLAALFAGSLLAINFYYAKRTGQVETELNHYVSWAKKQRMVPVEIVVTAPPETPADQMLYLSGSAPTLGAWDAAGVALAKRDDGKYHVAVDLMSGVEYAFKVTRGTWGTVERGAHDEELPNRVLTVDQPGKVNATVAAWIDHGKTIPGRITMTGDIRLHKKFHSKLLGNERTLIIYLPPGYDQEAEQRYPVLYMHDGQNLFDEATSFAGVEWGVDETAQKLIAAGKIPPIIIVGIYNTEQRTSEFTPGAASADANGPRGELYSRFVVEEVKPFIDGLYRSKPGREDTALAGSSMGGMITLYMAKAQNKVFGKVAAFTPWLRTDPNTPINFWGTDDGWLKGTKLWISMGSDGGTNYPGPAAIADAKALVGRLDAAGLKQGTDYQYVEITGGHHDEAAWAQQVEPMLLYLYGK